MRPKPRLETFHGVTKDVTHSYICRGCHGGSACQSFINGIILTALAHSGLHERHMLVTIVLMVKSRAGLVRVHHADLDHVCSPNCRRSGDKYSLRTTVCSKNY